MEQITTRQQELGNAIDKLWINFNKDSKDRKTGEYLQKRLDQVHELWSEFEKNDNDLRKLCKEPMLEEYFTKNYYQQVQSVYEKLTATIMGYQTTKSKEDIPQKATTSKSSDYSQTATTSKSSNKLVTALINAMSTLESILNTEVTPETPTAVIDHMNARIETYLKTIQDKEEQLLLLDDICYPHKELQQLQVQAEQTLLANKCRERNDTIQHTVMKPMLKLEKVSVPKFNGDETKWVQFRDLFEQLVHDQPMAKATKMFYLKDNVSGEAEKLIRHLHVSENNYDAAWSILKEKYNDKRSLLDRWLRIIMNIKPATSDSAESIKNLHDTIREATLAIDSLNIQPRQLWESVVMYIIAQKLDNTSRTLYEQALENPQELQPLESFIKFLQTRSRSLNIQGFNVTKKQQNFKTTMVSTNTNATIVCPICNKDHAIYNCETFLKQTPEERNKTAFKSKLCLNCLKKGHFTNTCKSRTCIKCGKKHNTLLHSNVINKTSHVSTADAIVPEAPSTDVSLNVASYCEEKCVFLATALVEVQDKGGNWVKCRALIDGGSQVNIVTEGLQRKLQLDGHSINSGLSGLGESRIKINNKLLLKVRSVTTGVMLDIDTYVMKHITSKQPQQQVDIKHWNIPQDIQLADPFFNKPQHIDLLLGAELYGSMMLAAQIRLNNNLPTLHESVFGWLIIGAEKKPNSNSNDYFCGIGTLELNDQIKKFWELEQYMPQQRMTTEETKCEMFFDATTHKDNGRYVVNIPLQNNASVLGDSKAMAFKRLLSMERKLSTNVGLRQQYIEFMRDYEQQGHMQEINPDQIRGPTYYFPHHCVVKPSSSTTKVRVVFDGSAKTSSNISLNEIMMNGPRIQDEIFDIILRFRTKKYVFTADIKQMYRQINIAVEDRNLQLILWRENPSDRIKTYQLNTVTYGTKSAPYLATKCLQRLAEDEEANYPLAAKASKDFYVDDIITGSNDIEEAVEIQRQLQKMLEAGGFQLRKWCSNHARLIESIPNDQLEIQLNFDNKQDEFTKPLGLTWHPIVDQFQPTVNLKQHTTVTKRSILADTAQLFDPLGLVNPVIVSAKIFMQQLWKLKLDWDEEVPAELQTKWFEYRNGLIALKDLRIPRYMFAEGHSGRIVLHAFADASEKAYGTAVYLATRDNNGTALIRLLCARSRVAPLKQTKLPCLELCAAKMAAELVKVIIENIKISVDDVYYWSDSQIVLSWIQRDTATLVTFVANRVADIQTLTNIRKWRYVPTQYNPADLISRGCTAKQLCNQTMWFSGPEFLTKSQCEWPKQLHREANMPEFDRTLKIILTTTHTNESILESINHGNSFKKLQRIMAFILRAVNNFKLRKRYYVKKANYNTSPSRNELETATRHIFKEIQNTEFGSEKLCLKQRKPLPKGSNLNSLAPFIDNDDLIRVGGRLEAAEISYDEKHPILLPQKHFVTRLYMAALHVDNLHAGPQTMTAISRQRVWIVQGRLLARSIVNNCIRCARLQPKMAKQIMGHLPANRVTAARPFINCGIDLCGPFWTHYNMRGRKPQKTYIVVFCCFAVKAVHFEVVSALTTDAFIGALKRFMARRGSCKNIYCDNGRNFVGAENKLKELQNVIFEEAAMNKINNYCNQRRIQFHFIPPRTPHMGGLWEACVKSFKHLMIRTVTSMALTYEELCTVAAEIEAVLNSRPITPLSPDPNDLNALTPGHFLIGEPPTATVDPHSTTQSMKLLSRWELVSYCRAEFWKRWSVEYITNLQKRAKWVKEYPDMARGTLVLIKEDNLPPLQWSMGRIVDLSYGRDGHVRVAYVRTQSGTTSRAIHNLAPLPVDISVDTDEKNNDNENNLVYGEPSVVTDITDGDNQLTNKGKRKQPQTTPPPSRRIKNASLSSATVMLILVLMLPLVLASKHVHIQPLTTNAGLFYDRIGNLQLSPTHWTVMAYFNLSGYHAIGEGITTLTERMKATSKSIDQSGPYQEIIAHFEKRLRHLQEFNDILDNPIQRKRRAAINIVGTVFNKLFGVLDAEYAENMKTTIEDISLNEQQLKQLLQNQTSVLDATINVIKKDREEVIAQTQQLQQSIKKQMIQMENSVNKELIHNRAVEYFNLLSSLITSYLQEYEQIQDNISDVSFGLHQGHVSTHIISPDQLKMQVQTIIQQIPSELRLPIKQEHDLLKLYKLMQIKGKLLKGIYVFKIDIPLVHENEFTLYRLHSLPVMRNKVQIFIDTTTDFLAIDIRTDKYYALTTRDFDKCSSPVLEGYVCDQINPIEEDYSKLHQCESALILAKTLPESCAISISYPKDVWTPLAKSGSWLYAVTTATTITVVCKTTGHERIIISNTGIISLDKGCTLRSKNITLTSYNNLITEFNIQAQPQIDLTKLDLPMNISISPQPNIKHQSSGLLFHQNIEHLKSQIDDMKNNQLNLSKLQPHDIHQFSVGYATLILVTLLIIWIVYRLRQNQPQPFRFVLPSLARREDVDNKQ